MFQFVKLNAENLDVGQFVIIIIFFLVCRMRNVRIYFCRFRKQVQMHVHVHMYMPLTSLLYLNCVVNYQYCNIVIDTSFVLLTNL